MGGNSDSSRNQAFPEIEAAQTLLANVQQLLAELPSSGINSSRLGDLVTEELLCETTGYTKDRLRGLVRRGYLQAGIHFVITPQGRRDWYTEEFDKWRRNGQAQATRVSTSEPTVMSESLSATEENGSTNESEFRQRLRAIEKP